MALKAVLSSIDEVPEALRSEYTEKDGKFHLQLDGTLPGFVPEADHNAIKAKVSEFRDNNIAVKKQLDDATAAANRPLRRGSARA